jgi:hypothetical protein
LHHIHSAMKTPALLVLLALLTPPAFAGNWFGSGPWANGMYYPGQLDGRYFANVYNNLGGTFTRVSTTNTFFRTNEVTTTVITNAGLFPVTNTVTTNIVTGPFFETNTTITGSVVSGVISFGIRDGTAPFVSGRTAASSVGGSLGGAASAGSSSTALEALSLDNSLNNFLVYVNGDVFVGATSANINPKSSSVSGVMANGIGRNIYRLATNSVAAGGGGAAVAGTTTVVLSIPSATASGYFNANVNNNKSPYTFAGGGTIAVATAVGGGSELDGTHDFNLNGIKTSGTSASAFPQTSAAANPQ